MYFKYCALYTDSLDWIIQLSVTERGMLFRQEVDLLVRINLA